MINGKLFWRSFLLTYLDTDDGVCPRIKHTERVRERERERVIIDVIYWITPGSAASFKYFPHNQVWKHELWAARVKVVSTVESCCQAVCKHNPCFVSSLTNCVIKRIQALLCLKAPDPHLNNKINLGTILRVHTRLTQVIIPLVCCSRYELSSITK